MANGRAVDREDPKYALAARPHWSTRLSGMRILDRRRSRFLAGEHFMAVANTSCLSLP